MSRMQIWNTRKKYQKQLLFLLIYAYQAHDVEQCELQTTCCSRRQHTDTSVR